MRRSVAGLAVVALLLVGAAVVPKVRAQEPAAEPPGAQPPAPEQPAAQQPAAKQPAGQPRARAPGVQEPRAAEPRAAAPPTQEQHSQSAYVIEQLVVGLYSTPDVTGERVTTVKSGDPLEVLERAGEQVRVRTAAGREGWIRAGYLQTAQPLRPQLAERTAEVARLKEEVSRLEKDLQAAHTGASTAPKPMPVASTEAPAPSSTAPAPGALLEPAVREPRRGLFGDSPEEGGQRVWPWALGAALVALCVGFALGILVLDRHIRRKYGGLRIY